MDSLKNKDYNFDENRLEGSYEIISQTDKTEALCKVLGISVVDLNKYREWCKTNH